MAQRRMMRHSNSGHAARQVWPFALADGEVSYVGEPVAIVVADNRYLAEDAAALVEVDYERAAARSPTAARRRAGAPRGPARARLQRHRPYKVAYGDVEAAFGKAAHVFHEELWQHRGAAHSIEGRGILAESAAPTTASPSGPRPRRRTTCSNTLTALLDLDESRLRVATPDIGGGFGPKLCVYSEDVAVVAAAQAARGARSNGSRTGASISPMRCRSATSTGRSRSRSTPMRRHARHSRPAAARPRRLCAAGRQPALQLGLRPDRPLHACRRSPWRSRSPPPTRRRCPRCAAPAIRRRPSRWSG